MTPNPQKDGFEKIAHRISAGYCGGNEELERARRNSLYIEVKDALSSLATEKDSVIEAKDKEIAGLKSKLAHHPPESFYTDEINVLTVGLAKAIDLLGLYRSFVGCIGGHISDPGYPPCPTCEAIKAFEKMKNP